MNTSSKITVGSSVKILKGCKARNVSVGSATIKDVTELGKDYGYSVRVLLAYNGRLIAFYARHPNRLADPQVSLNDGNPLHNIKICLS
jgi:hypothetical protein